MELSLLKIWNFTEELANASLNQLLKAGYNVNTMSQDIHIKIISALTGYEHDFFNELNNEIIADDSFLKSLENAEEEGMSHDDIFIKAIQESHNSNLKRIAKLQEKAKLAEEEANRKTLLEDTYDEKLEDICKMNYHDDSNFYFDDPYTGEKILLKPHHIFQYRDYCMDIDTVYRYILAGGSVSLEDDYISKIFAKSGNVDYSNKGLTNEMLKRKTYHENIRLLNFNGNKIDSLQGVHLPESIVMLFIDKNPLKECELLGFNLPNLVLLSMQKCELENINFEYLPKSLLTLNLSGNKSLNSLQSLKNIGMLKNLDIRDTGITKIDWSKFNNKHIKEGGTLKIYCDDNVKFTKTKPDWIELANTRE